MADTVKVTAATLGIAIALASLSPGVEGPSLAATLPTDDSEVAFAPTLTLRTVVRRAPLTAEIRSMLAALNARRAARGLALLRLDPTLCQVASAYALEMATRRFFGHNSPEGETPFQRMDRAHVQYGYAGENIALEPNAASASDALWHSPAHRENILEPHYARVGIAAASAPFGEIFVEDFSD